MSIRNAAGNRFRFPEKMDVVDARRPAEKDGTRHLPSVFGWPGGAVDSSLVRFPVQLIGKPTLLVPLIHVRQNLVVHECSHLGEKVAERKENTKRENEFGLLVSGARRDL